LLKQARRVKAVTSLKTASARDRHVQRIHAKRLRYALEFFAPLFGTRALKRYAKTVEKIQSTLGAGNDAAIALQLADQLTLSDAQRGFIRGYAAASQHVAAREGDRLVARLKRPKLAKAFRSRI
jgi:CHAD domain-containing protein